MEVKGFEKNVVSHGGMANKPDSEFAASVKCLIAKLGSNEVGKEFPDFPERVDGMKSSVDFEATLQDIDDEIQRFSNSKSSTIMSIEATEKSDAEIMEVERSSEMPDQVIKATVIDRDSIVEGKATDFNSMELSELSFEMG